MNEAERSLREEERNRLVILRRGVRQREIDLRWKKKRANLCYASITLTGVSVGTGLAWTALQWENRRLLLTGNSVCGFLALLSVLTLLAVATHQVRQKSRALADSSSVASPERYTLSRAELEETLETKREELQFFRAVTHPSLRERRSLYREDVDNITEQYQRESRKYRRVHNTLQSLVMTGSVGITTIAALDAKQWTWQNISIVAIGFCVTLSTAFTGYYKYRERSYFLQQTADAIEEEANALTLGVGEYRDFTEDEEEQALATFAQRVESLRNEQRRRQQQLDQPTEQEAPQNFPTG